jgi:hypothetical protein
VTLPAPAGRVAQKRICQSPCGRLFMASKIDTILARTGGGSALRLLSIRELHSDGLANFISIFRVLCPITCNSGRPDKRDQREWVSSSKTRAGLWMVCQGERRAKLGSFILDIGVVWDFTKPPFHDLFRNFNTRHTNISRVYTPQRTVDHCPILNIRRPESTEVYP